MIMLSTFFHSLWEGACQLDILDTLGFERELTSGTIPMSVANL